MKEYLGILAVFLTIAGYLFLFINIARGKTKPHPFTWLIWCFATCVIFLAQFLNGGGAGSWSMGATSILGLSVTLVAFKVNENKTIKKIDWLFFVLAITSLPLWFFTSNPFYAVLILTFVDLLGYAPTFRKAYHKPHEEYLPTFAIMSLRNVVSCISMEEYTATNLFFQIACTIANILVIWLAIHRRKILKNS